MTPPLFVAVAVPTAIAERLAVLGGGIPGARWVPADNMHVTVRYLGELENSLADEIMAALADINHAAFTLKVCGVGVFGKQDDPRLLYAGVEHHDDLMELRRRMERLLDRLGVPPRGRRYHPHITLARLNRSSSGRIGRFVEANNLLVSQPFKVESFALLESHRTVSGSVYSTLQAYALAPSR